MEARKQWEERKSENPGGGAWRQEAWSREEVLGGVVLERVFLERVPKVKARVWVKPRRFLPKDLPASDTIV